MLDTAVLFRGDIHLSDIQRIGRSRSVPFIYGSVDGNGHCQGENTAYDGNSI